MIWTIEKGLTRSGPRASSCGDARFERLQPADPGGDRGADALGICRDVETRIGLRLAGRRQREVREPIHAPRRLEVDVLRHVEVLHLAGEVGRKVGRVELRDRPGTRLAGDERRPGVLDRQGEAGSPSRARSRPRAVSRSPRPSAGRLHPEAAVDEEHGPRHEGGLVGADRNRTAPATSSGSPSRPSGVASSIVCVAPSGSTSVSCVLT